MKTFRNNGQKYKICHLKHQYSKLSSITITVYLPADDAVEGEIIRYEHDGVLREWEIVLAGGYGSTVLEVKG